MSAFKTSLGKYLLFAAGFHLAFCLSAAAQGDGEPLRIMDVRLSNHTGTAFVLSWRTNVPTTVNQVEFGLNPDNLDKVENDTLPAPSMIHYVQLTYLNENATYYYRIKSDGLETAVSSVSTFPQRLPQSAFIMLGRVYDQTDVPMKQVLVRSWLKWWREGNTGIDSTMWYAVLTNDKGEFSMDISNYRRYNGTNALYLQNQTRLYLEILGETQGVVIDSVLLTASRDAMYQDVGTFRLIDERKKAIHGIIEATGPVLANGRSASLVQVTVLDNQKNPVPNVSIVINASPDRGVTYLQPQLLTDFRGKTWGLVYSDEAEDKTIRAYNLTADSTQLDTFAVVSFIAPPGDISKDKTPPFIYYVTYYGDTQDNINPYRIEARVVDNFTVNVKLVWSITANEFTDTIPMAPVLSTDRYTGDIPPMPYNTVIRYFVMAADSAGHKVSKPDSIVSNPYVLPYRFEIVSPGTGLLPTMGITQTTDVNNSLNPNLSVRVDTWITSTVGIRSAVIKWRNISQSLTFFDSPLSHFGAHYWGKIPAQPQSSRVEYFIQVADSLDRVERDRRRAPYKDLFNYEILQVDSLGVISYADTTSVLGTRDVHTTRAAAMADFNGDGYLDIVTANYGQANSIYFYNPASGGFIDVTSETLGPQGSSKTTHVAVADVNADDNLDLIFANEGGQSRLYINNGLGRFEDFTSRIFGPGNVTYMPAENWNSTCVLAEDFNGDGFIDLFIANNAPGGEQNKLLFNDSLGVFRDVTDLFLGNPAPDQTVWAIAGDVNGDGYIDIVVINRVQNHFWYRNNGHGLFRVQTLTTESAPQARGGDLGDVDGDGDLDLVIAQSETQQKELFINDGKGNFTKDKQGRLPPESDDTYAVKFFDANMDGYLDIIYINRNQLNRLVLNDGHGFFTNAPSGMMPALVAMSYNVAVGDINRDNLPDLYIAEGDRRNTLLFSRPYSMQRDNYPSEFDLLKPANGDTVRANGSIFFRWQQSIPAKPADTIRYNFVLSQDSLFTPEKVVLQLENLTADTVVVDTSLAKDRRYWWKVFAFNKTGFPRQSRQVNNFLFLEKYYSEDPPQFFVLLNRNPVFPGYINLYILSSLPLAENPALAINLTPLTVSRIGQNEIWRAQYYSRSSFLLTVSGTSRYGIAGEFIETYSSVLLAAAEGKTIAAAPDGGAWLTIDQKTSNGNLLVLVEKHKPVKDEKMRARISSVNLMGMAEVEDIGALLEGDCYTFTILEGKLDQAASLSIKVRSRENESRLAVCILQKGVWQPLETAYDQASGVYSAKTGVLGTFALRSGRGSVPQPLPKEFSLTQNIPNPFNPSTVIGYTVAGSDPVGRVTIKIYNLRGSLVRTLVDRSHLPGTYTVQWDGRGYDGRELPSGVYFYRLNAAGINITRKMVLLR